MSLFVAVEVPDAARSAVAEAVAPLREAAPRLRWVDPQRYHLTLAFLGEVPDGRVAAVSAALGDVGAGASAFELALSGELGMFGRRVLWAGVAASAPLDDLAARVRKFVGGVVGLPDGDRPFTAHLTLARAGREKVRPELVAGAGVPPVRWPVEQVVLMRSAGGYSVVEAVALGRRTGSDGGGDGGGGTAS